MDPTLIALNRFGLGGRPGEPARISDSRGWLREQLDGGSPRLATADLPDADEIGAVIRGLREAQATRDPEVRQAAQRRVRELAATEVRAALDERVGSDRPFAERLVAFWSNHLCVSVAGKAQVAPLAGAYERDVIRPHALGRFADMVLASTRHPAMLIYLDNAQSIGPGSPAGRQTARGGRARGLNENYARELMELHTLGVEGGYTQADVTELARVLTGWSVGGAARRPAQRAQGDDMGFAFAPALHEPGARTVLGRRYPEGGVEQGEAVIRDLCAHPSTARFVATKLVRHFVADDPPAAAVDRIGRTFTDTEGDLAQVARSLVELPEVWEPSRRKVRSPQDWLTAVLRGLEVPAAPPTMPALLTQLRQPLWAPPSPKGWGDATRDWADPDALMNRAELARKIADRPGVAAASPTALARLAEVSADDPLVALLTDESIDAPERVALVLAGPAFQWR